MTSRPCHPTGASSLPASVKRSVIPVHPFPSHANRPAQSSTFSPAQSELLTYLEDTNDGYLEAPHYCDLNEEERCTPRRTVEKEPSS